MANKAQTAATFRIIAILSAVFLLVAAALIYLGQGGGASAELAALSQAAPVIGGFLNDAVQFYFEWHKSKPHYRTGPFEGCFMHDPSAVLSITNPDLFGTIEAPVRVITEGERIGQTVADSDQNTRPVAT